MAKLVAFASYARSLRARIQPLLDRRGLLDDGTAIARAGGYRDPWTYSSSLKDSRYSKRAADSDATGNFGRNAAWIRTSRSDLLAVTIVGSAYWSGPHL